MTDSIAVPDIVGTYAAQIREHLAKSPDASLTVPELCEALQFSDRIVRMGLDRLVFCREVVVTYRHEAHKRGSSPRQYKAAHRS